MLMEGYSDKNDYEYNYELTSSGLFSIFLTLIVKLPAYPDIIMLPYGADRVGLSGHDPIGYSL